ncbi:unnamed protein product [Adineta steineri]|uniref:Uncharacterized protein n=1 Tax=Adineta steineri TaxID=433720 RepID=A0A815IAW2_9BILA|nr:unnamed protein product [Adineta steineri]
MHSSTIIASIIVLVTIVAKHSSVATHDSYLQALRRRTHAYNYDKNQQRNMFLRRLAQQFIEDEDSDEGFDAIMRKRGDSVSNDGTILGISPDYTLWTRATLDSVWVKLPNSNGVLVGGKHFDNAKVIAVTQLNNGTILGIGTDYTLWTRATLNSDWVQIQNNNGVLVGGKHFDNGRVIAVTQLNNGTILGISLDNQLWTRATLDSDWVQIQNSNGASVGGKYLDNAKVIGVTQLNNGTILGISSDYTLWTRATLDSDWVQIQNSNGVLVGGKHLDNAKVIGVTQLNDGTILGIGTDGILWTRATLDSDWVQIQNSNGAVIGVTQLNYPKITGANGLIIGVDPNGKLWTRIDLESDWVPAKNNGGTVSAITVLIDGTIVGVDPNGKLWTRIDLKSDWVPAKNNGGTVKDVAQLKDGTIIGVDPNGKLWTRIDLNNNWVPAKNTGGQVQSIAIQYN